MFFVDTVILVIIAAILLFGVVLLAIATLHLAKTCYILNKVVQDAEKLDGACTMQVEEPESDEANDKLNEEREAYTGLIEAVNELMLGDDNE